jgi:hypothetical protein
MDLNVATQRVNQTFTNTSPSIFIYTHNFNNFTYPLNYDFYSIALNQFDYSGVHDKTYVGEGLSIYAPYHFIRL